MITFRIGRTKAFRHSPVTNEPKNEEAMIASRTSLPGYDSQAHGRSSLVPLGDSSQLTIHNVRRASLFFAAGTARALFCVQPMPLPMDLPPLITGCDSSRLQTDWHQFNPAPQAVPNARAKASKRGGDYHCSENLVGNSPTNLGCNPLDPTTRQCSVGV